MKIKSLPVVMAIAVVILLAMSTIGSVYAASVPTQTFPGDWTTGTSFQLADGGLKWTDLVTRSSSFRTAYTPLYWDDDDYNLVYKIRFTRWDYTEVGTRLFIGIRPNIVSTSASGQITSNAALVIDFWTQTENKRTVAFHGQSVICTSHGELSLSLNTDYYFHAKREGNVETLKITSGSIDGTVLAQATGTISGEKRLANYLQIGNQDTASSETKFVMSGTLHDVTPEMVCWKKYHIVTTQIYSEPAPEWYKYHTVTTTIGSEGYQWLQYHTVTSQIFIESPPLWCKYHGVTTTIVSEGYQWLQYHKALISLDVEEYKFEMYHKAIFRIESVSQIAQMTGIMVTLMLLFIPSLVAYAVIGRYGLLIVLSTMAAIMVLNNPSTIITGFIVWSTATVIIWRGYR